MDLAISITNRQSKKKKDFLNLNPNPDHPEHVGLTDGLLY